MSKYAADAAGALADVTDAGAAVTFSLASPGTYTPSTDTYSGSATTSVVGYAVQVADDGRAYEALSLKQGEAMTLFFTPTTFGQLPALESTVTWNSLAWSVKQVKPIAPDGTSVAAYVIVQGRGS